METKLHYPERYALVSEDEMTYLDGGSAVGTAMTVVGACVLGASYIWGIRQARSWLEDNGEGNIFTVAGKALDDLSADMSKSLSYFIRDGVAAATVVGLWPLSIILLVFN